MSKPILVYSSSRDRRDFSRWTYKPNIPQIVKCMFRVELEEAKRRVKITRRGKYSYTPSSSYIRAISKTFIKQSNPIIIWNTLS